MSLKINTLSIWSSGSSLLLAGGGNVVRVKLRLAGEGEMRWTEGKIEREGRN